MTVSDLILDALPRLAGTKPTGTTFYQAINHISSLLTRHLINRKSDLVRTTEMSLTVTPAAQTYNLPSGFISLAEKPFDAAGNDLDQLTKRRSEYVGITGMILREYELLGQQIVLYPALDPSITSITVKARCFTQADPITGPTQNIPFNGMFDQAYFQGVPRVVAKGLSVIQDDAEFIALIAAEVDTVLFSRIEPLPDRRMRRSHYL